MEGRIDEQEYDEFEKLLCEIPDATFGNLRSENSGSQRVLLDDYNLLPRRAHFQEESIQTNRNLDEQKPFANKIQQSSIKRALPGETNLPNAQSLTSAFAKLRFKNGLTTEAASPPLPNHKSLPKHPNFMESYFTNSTMPNVDSHLSVVSSFQSDNNVPFGFDEFDVTKLAQENSELLKHKPIELEDRKVGHFHPTGVQLANGVEGLQFLSNGSVAGVDFAVMSNQQQQFFMDTQPPLPYLHSQLNQPQIRWRNMEEEHYRIHQQDLYLQQLYNQRTGIQQTQLNEKIAARVMSQKRGQPCPEIPISHQHEQFKQEPLWNNYAFARHLNHSIPALSATEFNAIQVLDKAAKHNCPEKILTRLHGLNTLRNLEFGSRGGDGSLTNISQNVKVLSNGLKSTDIVELSEKGQSVDEVTGRILLMAKDQHGCRFLQRKFTEGSPKDVELIFVEIIDHIVELMTDPFGNYLVQKLLEVCDENQQMQILSAITKKPGELVRISCDMHGTRAVQKVIETIKSPVQFSMVVSALKTGIVTLMKDMNGNHVAQRCLQYLMPENNEFLFDAATTNCVELARDRHGCCVLQKCLNYDNGEKRRLLIREIASNSLILSQDQYGNYVVQYVFALQFPWATRNILDQLVGNYGDLSMQKYSSNVIEKCLIYADEEHFTQIIEELIKNPRLDQIMQDPYGNYVIQEALKQSKGLSLHGALVEAIRPHVPVLRTSPYGKKVLSSNRLKK